MQKGSPLLAAGSFIGDIDGVA